MSPNPQKNPLIKSLNSWAQRGQEDFGKLLGQSVPASVVSVEENGTIVTVSVEINGFTFPKVRAPVGMPEWIRLPLSAGTKGVLLSADYYMGGMSGIGGGRAEVLQMSNLSNGIFYPIGNTGFDAADDPNKLGLYGPDGVILRNGDGTTKIDLEQGVSLEAPLGENTFKATWTEASSNAEAKSKGIPFNGLYRNPDGSMHWQRIPD